MTSKAEFLGQLRLFENLEADELEELAAIAEEYAVEDGAVIAYQRDLANRLYVVRSGRLYAHRVDQNGVVRDSHSYLPGDYFQDDWLFTAGVHPATVKASGPGVILVIPEDRFLLFLENYGLPVEALNLSPVAAEESVRSRVALAGRRYRALRLLPDELVKYDTRRSKWVLLLRLIGPAGGILLVLLVTIFLGRQGGWSSWTLLVPGLVLLAMLLWLGFVLIDWLNDYFIITTKHLAHREFDLRTFSARISKTPIDQIQSVEVERPNLISTLFNIGTARVTTAAQAGVIYFDYVDDPDRVKDTLNELREMVRALDAGRIQAMMRRSVESHFDASEPLSRINEQDEGQTPALAQEEPGFLRLLAGRIWRAFGYRVEVGDTITYRKHIFVLIGQTWWLMLPFLALLVGLVVVPSISTFLILFTVWVIVGGWLGWRLEDWRNDTFQVTDRYVIDIDRKPFGFGESRKQAELGNVQNVRASRPNLLAALFNYGNVVIETAGATADITFESVADPNHIQSDIFKRREEFRQRQRVRDGERQRQEYAVLLDVYQQAREQNRIPRRTPPQETLPPPA